MVIKFSSLKIQTVSIIPIFIHISNAIRLGYVPIFFFAKFHCAVQHEILRIIPNGL